MGGKFHPEGLKMALMKKVEHAPSEEMILNVVRFRGSPTSNFALLSP